MELKKIELNNIDYISAMQLQKELKSIGAFNTWIKRVVKRAYLQEDKDFRLLINESTGGRPSTDYLLTIESAKRISIISNTLKSKEIIDYLIDLDKKVQSGYYTDTNQIIWVIKIVKVFSIYEYRKLALNKNSENFINNAIILKPELQNNKPLLYSKLHEWRNEILHLGKEELNERLLDYCILEKRAFPKLKNKDEILTFFGEYEQIKTAIWDLLSSQNKSQELITNICNLASEIAKEIRPYLERFNENNLFNKKVELKEVKQILSIT